MASIAVLMPTFNSAKWLDQVLLPLKSQKHKITLIIAEGGSSDGTLRKVLSHFPNTIVKLNISGNLASARNTLLRQLEKLDVEYACFVDSDVVVPDNFYNRMINCLEDPEVCIVGLRFELEHNPPKGFVGKYFRQRTDITRTGIYYTDYTTTACSMWRAELAKGIVLDERLRRAGEDVDFNLQLREKGNYKALVDSNDPPAWHIRPATVMEELKRTKDHGLARALLMKLHRKSIGSTRYKKTLLNALLTLIGWVSIFTIPITDVFVFIPFGIIFARQWMKTKQKWRLDYAFFGFILNVIYTTRFLQGVIKYAGI